MTSEHAGPVYELEVTIPGLVPACSWGNARCHWRKRAADVKDARLRARLCAVDALNRNPPSVRLDLLPVMITEDWEIILAPRQRQRDIDNAIAGMKPYQDGIFDVLGVNDKAISQVGVTWTRGTNPIVVCRLRIYSETS